MEREADNICQVKSNFYPDSCYVHILDTHFNFLNAEKSFI